MPKLNGVQLTNQCKAKISIRAINLKLPFLWKRFSINRQWKNLTIVVDSSFCNFFHACPKQYRSKLKQLSNGSNRYNDPLTLDASNKWSKRRIMTIKKINKSQYFQNLFNNSEKITNSVSMWQVFSSFPNFWIFWKSIRKDILVFLTIIRRDYSFWKVMTVKSWTIYSYIF